MTRLLAVLVLLAGVAHAQTTSTTTTPTSTTTSTTCNPAPATTTPRASLKRPVANMCAWGLPIQQTFDILDTNAGFLNIPSTWTAKQTFAGGISGETGSGETRRLGSIMFDLGSATLTTADHWTFRLDPYNAHVTRIECEAYTGLTFTIKVCKGEDEDDNVCATNLLNATDSTGTLVCNTTGASDTTINSPAVTPRQKVTVLITAVTGTVTRGEVFIEGTVD